MPKTIMTRIHYIPGPPSLTAGVAGSFTAGVSKEVDDDIAQLLFERGDIEFKEGYGPNDEKRVNSKEPEPKL